MKIGPSTRVSTLTILVTLDGECLWTFKHPTIGDAYSAMLRSSPELLGIYVRGSEIEKLMRQITCGEVGIDGAVVVSVSLYETVIERIATYETSSAYKTKWMSGWRARRELLGFLARRCGKQFLESYLAAEPKLIESVIRPSLHLEFSVEVDFAIRLFKLGLLPEDARRTFVEAVSKCVRDGDDARVLSDPELRSLLTDKELSKQRESVRTLVLPRIEEVRLAHQAGREPEDDPVLHMRRFTQLLSVIAEAYPHSGRISKIIKRERLLVHDWIDENLIQADSENSRDITIDGPSLSHSVSRSIFDDVDD